MNNQFEDNWRKAFEDAADSPPDSVWAKIEARLDEKPLPWWNRFASARVLVAAGVSLLLLTGLGWWINGLTIDKSVSKLTKNAADLRKNNTVLDTKRPVTTAQNQEIKTKDFAHSNNKKNKPSASLTVAKTNKHKNSLGSSGISEQANSKPTTMSSQVLEAEQAGLYRRSDQLVQPPKLAKISLKQKLVTQNSLKKSINSPRFPTSHSPFNQSKQENIISTAPMLQTEKAQESTPVEAVAVSITPSLDIDFLLPKSQTNLAGIATPKPSVAYNLPASSQVTSANIRLKPWVSLGLAPQFFNSQLQTNTIAAASNATFATADVKAGPNQAAFSYSVQLAAGFQFKSRWSLETGIGYLRGNSVYKDISVFNPANNLTRNSLEVAIAQSPNTSGSALADASKSGSLLGFANSPSSAISTATSQTVHNQFSYLQIPLQVGYAIVQDRKKLSLWLLGGFSNTVLLSNQFENGANNAVSFGFGQGPFRTFSVTASTGLRLQYRFAGHWSGTLTGNYQQTLGNTTRANATFSARPQWWGLGCGLRYQF